MVYPSLCNVWAGKLERQRENTITPQQPVEQPATKIIDFDPVKHATDEVIQLAFSF
mgnify:CR=1 FL=1